MKKNIFYFIITGIMISGLLACHTPTALYRQGDYDASIFRAVEKLRGKKLKDKDLIALESAFNTANLKDKARLDFLLKDPSTEKWEQVHTIASRIADRQQLVEPWLPVYIRSEHREVALKLFDVDDLVVQSRGQAAETLYQNALASMALAREGDKAAARKAYDRLTEIRRYFETYKNRDGLMQEARSLGIERVLVTFHNRTQALLPQPFEREIHTAFSGASGDDWLEYHISPKQGIGYDYTLSLSIETVSISPETVHTREFIEQREVEDGWNYVLDSKGNVMKDSLGNDIRQKRYVQVSAIVREIRQHKEAVVAGRIECRETASGRMLFASPIQAGNGFDHDVVTYQGDIRALSTDTRNRLGNGYLPFPTNEAMLMRAATDLRNAARNAAWLHNDMLIVAR